MRFVSLCLCLLFLACPAVVLGQDTVEHDPWLNWDFLNTSGSNADNFEMIFESATYNPGANWVCPEFPNFSVAHADYDGDTDIDTKVTWTANANTWLAPDTDWVFANEAGNGPGMFDVAHVGLDMTGFEALLDAYWTWSGQPGKVGNSIAAPEEITQIIPVGSAEVRMRFEFPKAFYDDGGTGAGLQNIRTFRDIPADLLGLEDINSDLNLDALHDAGYEVTPDHTSITPGVYHSGTYFYISLGVTDDEYIGPDYESLLYAEILAESSPAQVIGRFWNLNPQSPEPATLCLFALGGLFLRRRRH